MATAVPDTVLDGSRRRLGSAGSVLLALSGAVGTGVFIVFAPAARAAGVWLLPATAVAALVAACTACSLVDLAARCPAPAEGYHYGRELIAPCAGRLAGVAFLAGRTASAAAASGVFATYVLPTNPLWVAIPVVLVVGALNAAGVSVTARGPRVLVAALLAVLAVVVVVGLTGHAEALAIPAEPPSGMPAPGVGPAGVLTAAGLLFFAFAGYPRIAPGRGEDRTRPRRPMVIGFAVLTVTYLAVGAALLHSQGASRLADTLAPLAVAASTEAVPALGVLVRVAAAAATVAALLTVLASVGRTTSAMAEHGDLPAWLARVNRRGRPWRADLVATLGAAMVAVLAGPVGALGLAACCLLVHYAVVNLAALQLTSPRRRHPRWTALLGLPLCLLLAVLLPLTQVLVSALLLVLGLLLTFGAAARRGRVRSPDAGEGEGSGDGRAPTRHPTPPGTPHVGHR